MKIRLTNFVKGLVLMVVASQMMSCSSSKISFNPGSTKLPFLPPPEIFYLPGEDTLTIKQFVVDECKAEQERKMFKKHIKRIRNKFVDPADIVDSAAFNEMYIIAEQWHKKEASLNFTTALKIYMGRDLKTRRIVLVYQPLYLIHKCGSPQKKLVKYVEGNYNDPNIYFIHDNGLKKISPEEAKTYMNNYKEKIRIRNGSIDIYRRFNQTYDRIGDTESVTFAFQEIFALIRDNRDTLGKAKKVIILNVAVGPSVEGKKYYVKHTLLLGSDLKSMTKGVKNAYDELTGKCANLGNRNPPADIEYGTAK